MKKTVLSFILLQILLFTAFAQSDCSKVGVDYKSFGASILPYGFEELTTVNFKTSICENQYYELRFWVSKDIYLAKMQRQWAKHERMRFEVQLFLAVSGDNYNKNRQYQPIIFELNSANAITLDQNLDKFTFKIYADAPYDVLTIGYKPIEGWWNVDRFFVEDIITVSSLSFNMIEQEIKEVKVDSAVAKISPEDTFDFESVKLKSYNNRSLKNGSIIHVYDDDFILEITDHLEFDKDSINVYLNDSLILSNYELKNEKLDLALNLKEGINIIVLEAINLGEFSPNTASFKLKFKDEEHKKIMFSNLKQSDVVYLNYIPIKND